MASKGKLTEKDKARLKEMYETGVSYERMRDELDVTDSTISYHVAAMGLKPRSAVAAKKRESQVWNLRQHINELEQQLAWLNEQFHSECSHRRRLEATLAVVLGGEVDGSKLGHEVQTIIQLGEEGNWPADKTIRLLAEIIDGNGHQTHTPSSDSSTSKSEQPRSS